MNELIESVSVYINSPTEVLTGSDSGISPISICKYEWYVRNYHNHTVYHYDKSTEWRNDKSFVRPVYEIKTEQSVCQQTILKYDLYPPMMMCLFFSK